MKKALCILITLLISILIFAEITTPEAGTSIDANELEKYSDPALEQLE